MCRVASLIHRFIAIPLLLLALVVLPRPASAIDMQGSTIEPELRLPDTDSSGAFIPEKFHVSTVEEDIKDHFNLAHCMCGAVEFAVEFTLENAPASLDDKAVDIRVGTNCDHAETDQRDRSCERVGGYGSPDDLRDPAVMAIPVHKLVAANSDICAFEDGERSVYALIDEGNDGIGEGDYVGTRLDIPFDLNPPPVATNTTAKGGENAIQLNWDLPSSRTEDVDYFQVLCTRADGTINTDDKFPRSGLSTRYVTAESVCGVDDGVHPISTQGVDNGADAGVDPSLPESLYNLDKATLCGEVTGTGTSARVSGLENGVAYRIVLVMVDEYRNATALDLGEATPQPVRDGWEHYLEDGNADGGFCFVATATYGNYDHPFVVILRNFRDSTLAHSSWGRSFISWYYANSPGLAAFIAEHESARFVSYIALAPLVAFAAVWEYTTFLGKLALLLALGMITVMRRRRRRHGQPQAEQAQPAHKRRLVTAVATVAVLLCFGATANAQPYWDELNEPLDGGPGSELPTWNFEIKAGPYFPGIDDEFSGDTTPFKDVFGDDWNIMTFFVLDHYFSVSRGQLGITASVGYTDHTANAFEVDGNGNIDENMTRSAGDKTSFRLIPMSLGAVYRLTELDDRYRIPIIPYAKASLAYYLWMFTAPSGDASEVMGNKGRGGSLGFQGTIGIALRAERLDPEAELSLRTEMGVEHAGFFAELQMAQVDGFGADNKLSVGDTTWFGGINFEF